MTADGFGDVPKGGTMTGVRSILFAGWMFGLAIVMGIVCLPVLLGSERTVLTPIQLWARWVLAGLKGIVGQSVQIQGREHTPSGPALIAAKHQGMLDILIGLTLLPFPCFIMKKELMWVPIFGWYSARAGMIPIDRSAGASAVRAMTAAAQTALAQNRQVVVYPEGTRRAPGAAPDYKPGVAALYRELGLACTPLATNSGRLWPAQGLAKHAGVSTYALLAPIPPGLKRAEFMSLMKDRIEEASATLLGADRLG